MSRIVHLALKVEDLEKTTEIPVKFRAPGGTVAELVPVGRYKQPPGPQS